MRKLCLVPALLLAATSASAETPVKLWNDYVYNQPVESVKAEAGIFDCSQRGRADVLPRQRRICGPQGLGRGVLLHERPPQGRLALRADLPRPLHRCGRRRAQDGHDARRPHGPRGQGRLRLLPGQASGEVHGLHRPRARHEGNRASQGQEGGLRLHRRQDAP